MQKEENRSKIVESVRKWGGLATDAVLDPRCQHFQTPHIEGFIAYRTSNGCAVVYGDPICSPSLQLDLALQFQQRHQEEYRNIIYVTASEPFAKSSFPGVNNVLIDFGNEISLNPQLNPMERQGNHGSLVRRKVHHAQRLDVLVQEYVAGQNVKEEEIEEVGIAWLKGRKGPQIHISQVHLFENRLGKRWFYAQQGSKIVGTVVINQLQARKGWHLNHLMTTPDAPNGTPELLVVSVLEALKKEECTYVSCGIAPKNKLGLIEGLSFCSSSIARIGYRVACQVFRLNGHGMFWGKFDPEMRSSYLLFQKAHIGLKETFALSQAMNVSV